MSLLFSYLNSVQHNSVIELFREQLFLMVPEKIAESFLLCFFSFFNNALFHVYFVWELTILWLTKILFLCKYGSYIKIIILTYILISIIWHRCRQQWNSDNDDIPPPMNSTTRHQSRDANNNDDMPTTITTTRCQQRQWQ